MPSNAHDTKGLLVSSIREDNPVVFVKHKMLFGQKGPCSEELFEVPLGVANVTRPGRDVTLVTYGRMVGESLKAASILSSEGVDVEVIDLRTLQPMDSEAILASVKRTNHAVVVHEAVRFAGLGAEIAAQIQEECFDYLDAPVGRVGAPFSPVPFAPSLEKHYVPDAKRIADGVREAVARQSTSA
jgi:pyruvate/2-oxoglutarate/acetoin dehydrogenase E1 component